ncbi:MAG: alkaline phosphatase family protein [Actinomycetota bacterium]
MMRRARLIALLTALAATALAFAVAPAPIAVAQSATERQIEQVACDLPAQFVLRTWRGWRADRGPDIQMIAKEPNYVGSGLPHVGPWEYVQHVPMFWYGPGHIAPIGRVERPVTVAGIAPTMSELLDTPFTAIDGQPMREALGPKGERIADPPKLVLTLIWDAAGMNVLDVHENSWPFLRSLIPDGTWYDNATVGSSPTSTAQIHATIGTGAFPRNSGLVGHRLRIGPEITTPWQRGPAYIDVPTFADIYDREYGNEPKVGLMGTVSIHAGMLGHGAMWGGGDKDLLLLRQAVGGDTLTDESFQWNLPPLLQPYYTFPAYANDVPGFEEDVDEMDRADGKLDDKWRDNEIAPLLQGFDTPARPIYQEQVLEEIIAREGFGADDQTDLLFVNHKIIDYISHVWTLNSPEMNDAIKAEDRALETLVSYLDEKVGEGEWVLGLTADHGAIPDPKVSGAFQISTSPIAAGINIEFDSDGDDDYVVELVQPTGIFMDEAELRENGHTFADVAAYVMGLTKEQAKAEGTQVPAGEQDDAVFEAAFPSEMMDDLPCLPEARG